jgi:hypothetical protein
VSECFARFCNGEFRDIALSGDDNKSRRTVRRDRAGVSKTGYRIEILDDESPVWSLEASLPPIPEESPDVLIVADAMQDVPTDATFQLRGTILSADQDSPLISTKKLPVRESYEDRVQVIEVIVYNANTDPPIVFNP